MSPPPSTKGAASATEAAEFVVGALLAFVVLVAVAARPPQEPGPLPPLTGLARYNVTPLLVIALVALVVHVLSSPSLGFLLAGLIAAGGYTLAISLLEVYAERDGVKEGGKGAGTDASHPG